MAVKLFWRKELQGQIVALRGLRNVFKHFESAISSYQAKEQGEEKINSSLSVGGKAENAKWKKYYISTVETFQIPGSTVELSELSRLVD